MKAEIIADSKNLWGDRITTFKLVFPRYILAEVNTHRAFSKNSASSRAIPFKKMVKMVEENPFIPMAWQKDHKGMQGSEYYESLIEIQQCIQYWENAKNSAILQSKLLNSQGGVTKQMCNRLLEPFMWHTVLLTTTGEGLENFFDLRCPDYHFDGKHFKSRKEALEYTHRMLGESDFDGFEDLDWLRLNKGQADIHMMALAEEMYDVYNESKPKELGEGDWHIPMGETFDDRELDKLLPKFRPASVGWYIGAIEDLKIKIATARCARISYETLGDEPKINYEADLRLYQTLLDSKHFSPMEHCARAMSYAEYYHYNITKHEDLDDINTPNMKYYNGWCRNFRGFIQHRELL